MRSVSFVAVTLLRLRRCSSGAVAHWWSWSCPLAPALRGEGEGEGSSLGNLPVIPREFASLTRSPRHDDQSTRTAEYEAPLTLALSPQSRGEGTKQAAQGLTTNSRLHPRHLIVRDSSGTSCVMLGRRHRRAPFARETSSSSNSSRGPNQTLQPTERPERRKEPRRLNARQGCGTHEDAARN